MASPREYFADDRNKKTDSLSALQIFLIVFACLIALVIVGLMIYLYMSNRNTPISYKPPIEHIYTGYYVN